MDALTLFSYRYERMFEIQGHPVGAEPRFQLVRFHPRFPVVPILGVAINDGRVCLVDLSEANGAVGDEALMYRAGMSAKCGAVSREVTVGGNGAS
jgi:hypothetical protein